jgi:hypothetical protein
MTISCHGSRRGPSSRLEAFLCLPPPNPNPNPNLTLTRETRTKPVHFSKCHFSEALLGKTRPKPDRFQTVSRPKTGGYRKSTQNPPISHPKNAFFEKGMAKNFSQPNATERNRTIPPVWSSGFSRSGLCCSTESNKTERFHISFCFGPRCTNDLRRRPYKSFQCHFRGISARMMFELSPNQR